MRQAYKPHRGRSRVHGVLKVIFIVVAALVVLTIGALLYMQQYMVYTADGTARLQLPFGDSAMPAPTVSMTSQPPIVTLSPSPTTGRKKEKATVSQLYTLGELNTQTLEEIIQKQEMQVAIEMKSNDGTLLYASEQKLAPERADTKVELASVLQRLHREKQPVAAFLSCFQDNWLPKQQKSLALTTSKKTLWQDGEKNYWLNPYLTENQAYLIGVATELAQLGFDEIILEHCGFPDLGKTERIFYGTEETPFTAIMDQFLNKMNTALKEFDVCLSVVTDEKTVLEGTNPDTGQTLTSLLTYADRIYVELEQDSITTRADLEQAIEAAREKNKSGSIAPVEFYLVSIVPTEAEVTGGGSVFHLQS